MYLHIFFFVGWISHRLLHVCACWFLDVTLADLPSTLCEFVNSKLKPSGQVCSLEHPLLVSTTLSRSLMLIFKYSMPMSMLMLLSHTQVSLLSYQTRIFDSYIRPSCIIGLSRVQTSLLNCSCIVQNGVNVTKTIVDYHQKVEENLDSAVFHG